MAEVKSHLNISEVISAYSHIGNINSIAPYGNGHINDTFLVSTDTKKYIIQRINNHVFKNPMQVMENIDKVTSHIRKKAAEDIDRTTLTIIPTNSSDLIYEDSNSKYWRMYRYIEDTVAREKVENSNDFYSCAYAFGQFQYYLSDFPAEVLFESIKDFHNTPKRYENFCRAVKNDICSRASSVEKEIEFVTSRKEFCQILEKAHESGDLPLRVTHNDTKLNNILFDAKDGHAVCVIDLDTVMPGYSVNDFGDSIRFGANTAAEDERDLSLVSLDLELFKTYAEGFIKGCNGGLTDEEISLLTIGAMMMTLECGIRFLTDYLEGDVYFKTHRAGHNLDRARNQFALLSDMERKLNSMNEIIESIKNNLAEK